MSSNGTTENDSGRRNDSFPQAQPSRMEQIPSDSGFDGVESVSIGGEDRRGKDTTWKLVPIRDTTAGKILERIEALEARHIRYVDAHESRLRARLEEDKAEKEEFLQESNQIKSDIYHLAIAQNTQNNTSENGHIN